MTRISKVHITPAALVAIFGLAGTISTPGTAQALGPGVAPLFRAGDHDSPAATERLILASCEVGCSEDVSENPDGHPVDPGKPDGEPEKPKGETENPNEGTSNDDGETGTTGEGTGTGTGTGTGAGTGKPTPPTNKTTVVEDKPKAPAAFDPHDGPDREPTLASLNAGSTTTIALLIADANRSCGPERLRLYRIDCLRVHYQRVADRIPTTGEYGPVKQALADAAAQLDQIVTANLDTTAPQVRPRERGKPLAPRLPNLRAVKPGAEAAANAAAEKVVTQTAMLILRSGEDPKRRTAHYREIVAAVDSNLLLLRSA
jgi:hypothetical protein